jgi:hypothetical protein
MPDTVMLLVDGGLKAGQAAVASVEPAAHSRA